MRLLLLLLPFFLSAQDYNAKAYEDFSFVDGYESIYTTIDRVAAQMDISEAFKEGHLPFFFYQKCTAVTAVADVDANKEEWLISDGFRHMTIRHKIKNLSTKDENTSDLDYQSKVSKQIDRNVVFFLAEYLQDLRSNYDKKNLSEKEDITSVDLFTQLYSNDYRFCDGFRESIEADGFDLSKESTFYD